MRNLTLFWTALCCLLLTPLAWTAEIHVSAIGSLTGSGTSADPARTITRGMDLANAGDVIVVNAGVYRTTMGEVFPIKMKDGVSIQGVNALNTVLFVDRNEGLVFDGNDGDFLDTIVQGITITNAQSAILMNGPPVKATIANCFLIENSEGVRMNSVFTNQTLSTTVDSDQNGYTEHQPLLQSLTICRNTIGILDAGDAGLMGGAALDPDGSVDGEARPCIVNCVVFGNTKSDLEGVDSTDVASTAFFTVDAFGFSRVRPPLSLPSSPINLSAETVEGLFIHPDRGDYRLEHFDGHPLVDAGDQFAVCANGTQMQFSYTSGLVWFQDDCEGYGNSRYDGFVPAGSFVTVDIGADEQGEYSLAGFSPFSTSFVAPNFLTIELRGSSNFATPTNISNWLAISSALGYQPYLDSGSYPSARPLDSTDPTPLPIGGTTFLPLGTPNFVTTLDLATSTPPGAPNRFYTIDIPIGAATIAQQWMWQVLPFDLTPFPPVAGVLGNLQHFQIGANQTVPFAGGGGFYRGPGDVVPLPFGFDLSIPLEEYCEIVDPICCEEEEFECEPMTRLPDRCTINPNQQRVILEGYRWTVGDLLDLCESGCLEDIVDENGNFCICIESTRPASIAFISQSPLLTNFQQLQEAVSLLICVNGVPLGNPGPIICETIETPATFDPTGQILCDDLVICLTFNLDCLCEKVAQLAPFTQLRDQYLFQIDFELCGPCPPGQPTQ